MLEILDEVDALGDVPFEALNCLLQQLLLFIGQFLQGIGGLFSTVWLIRSQSKCGKRGRQNVFMTYSELNGNREEVATSLLGNFLAPWHAWKIDIAWFNKAFLALDSSQKLLGKPKTHSV